MYLLSKFFKEASNDYLVNYFGSSDIDEIFKLHSISEIEKAALKYFCN